MLKQIAGIMFTLVLGTLSFVFLFPIVVIGLIFIGTVRSLCLARGKHTYPINKMLNGVLAKDLVCTVCWHKPSDEDIKTSQMQYVALIDSLAKLKASLDLAFRSNEELVIDNLIEDTK